MRPAARRRGHIARVLPSLFLVAAGTPVGGQPFAEVAGALGLDFEHRHFGAGAKHMPENMGAGVAVFDSDGDGRLDIYLVQGAGSLEGATPDPEATNRLFRHRDDGAFLDVTDTAGVGDPGYGMGAAFADIDRDGDNDLFVSNYGPDSLYRNRGDGSFEEVSRESGVAEDAWSTSAGFFDADGDGDLDLYVTHYLRWTSTASRFCGNAQAGIRAYCHPDVYDGAADSLFRNDGTGRFTRVSVAAGILATVRDKGLGLTFADLDGNGTQDIYVANDSTRNYLYLGDGSGAFREGALLAGVGVNGLGAREASMGVDFGDFNADGRPDLFVTHLDEETNTLYASDGEGLWVDRTAAAGLAQPSLPWVGFGTVVADFDLDGDEDIFVANGHIIDNIALFDPARRARQPAQLFVQTDAGTFVDASDTLGLGLELVGRGAVGADLDRDGDVDLLVTQNGGRAVLLRNDSRAAGRGLLVALRGTRSNPAGIGARVELITPRRRQVRWQKSAVSYLSQGPTEAHFSLPLGEVGELVVYWPVSGVQRHPGIRPGSRYTVTEGGGIDALPLSAAP